MNLLDAKVILTELEKEVFIDEVSNIELDHFYLPDENHPYFKVFVGLIMGRIRDNEFYGKEKVWFGIKMTEDLETVRIFDPERVSIFAARNEKETTTVTELINYVLTKSPSFKQGLKNMMQEKETPKVKLAFLERLSHVQPSQIHFEQQKSVAVR